MAQKALKERLEENLYENRIYEPIITENDSSNVIPFVKQSELQTFSIAPDFVITLSEAKQRIQMLQQFVKEMMIEGQDYGLIPNCNKPSLFKAGAEKLTDIFGFSKHIEITNRVEDWDKGLFHYEVKATLINKRSGQIEAEGIGCCNNKEKKYTNSPACNIINTILKMAKKRAFIDAVLSATRSSGLFTQDIEDTGDYEPQYQSQYSQSSSSRQNPQQDSNQYSRNARYNEHNNLKNTEARNSFNPKNTNNSNNSMPPIPNTSSSTNSSNKQNQYVPENPNSQQEDTPSTEKIATKAQLNKIQSIVNQKNIAVNTAKFLISDRYGVSESRNLNIKQADDFIKYLSKIQ